MAFSRHVCWKNLLIGKVMETEALQSDRAIFLATHQPIKMYRENLDLGSTEKYDEQRLLQDFMSPERFNIIAVLGSSGIGKSHLVRWMSMKIEPNSRRKVLLIPKVGTNLKNVIERILDGMEGKQFDDYRNRLNQATCNITKEHAMLKLMDRIAESVGPHGNHNPDKLTGEGVYLITELPHLFHDPFFREHFLSKGSIIEQLIEHILGSLNRRERRENKRTFDINDLPLSIKGTTKASEKARDLYRCLIGEEELQREAVTLINDHLDDAIAGVLDFSGEDLLQLMLDVRETLAENGMELIILIEDFAKLQGIDRQLLETLLIETHVEGRKPLCPQKTALAVTTGYFKTLDDTVRTRIRFRVNLDVKSTGPERYIIDEDIMEFVGRYLNAIRLSPKELDNWFNEGCKEPVLIACEECPHREACHKAFSSAKGMGLYPFTPQAILNMLDRISPGSFNPRMIINKILKHTLESYTKNLEDGKFPPAGMLDYFGGSRLGVLTNDLIRKKDSNNDSRRQTLIDLWYGKDELVNLAPGIHEAFDLPLIDSAVVQKAPQPVPSKAKIERKPETIKTQAVNEKLLQQIEDLNSWANGKNMTQTLARELRDLVFPSVVNSIDWDFIFLEEKKFAGPGGKPFQSAHIKFRNQLTRTDPAPGKINLIIPVDSDSFIDDAMALQGLLQFNNNGNWDFPNGSIFFRKFAAQLEKWKKKVIEQIQARDSEGTVKDPVPLTTEILVMGNMMEGLPAKTGEPDLEDYFNSLFLNLEENIPMGRSNQWKNFMKSFRKKREGLIDALKSRIACIKGSSAKIQIIDASRLVDPINQVTKSGKLSERLPVGLYLPDSLGEMRDEFNEKVEVVLSEEKKRYIIWLDKVTQSLGTDPSQEMIVKSINNAILATIHGGVYPGNNPELFQEAVERFSQVNLKEVIDIARQIKIESKHPDLFRLICKPRQKEMEIIETLIDKYEIFIKDSNIKVDQEIEKFQTIGDIDEVIKDINEMLKEMLQSLSMTGE